METVTLQIPTWVCSKRMCPTMVQAVKIKDIRVRMSEVKWHLFGRSLAGEFFYQLDRASLRVLVDYELYNPITPEDIDAGLDLKGSKRQEL
jgi:hypothetical protein